MTTPAILTTRLRQLGHCPPSLLAAEETKLDDSFLVKVSNLVQDGVKLRENATVQEIQDCLELANSAGIDITDAIEKGKAMVQRRAILLAIIGATPPDNEALKGILNNGLLVTIKSWLDEILNVGLGGVDLLLHLLGGITMLPVSKEMVTSSKLGKQVAAVEKHAICKGGLNEIAIKERVSKVKEEWSASVKRLKKANAPMAETVTNPGTSKRPLDYPPGSPLAAKKAKKSLSSYLSKVSGAVREESAAELSRKRAQEKVAQLRERLAMKRAASNELNAHTQDTKSHSVAEKMRKNVKWADMEGGPLTVSQGHGNARHDDDDGASWNDRKKNDRVREKEFLEKARKSKLEDQDDSLDTMVMMHATGWRQPQQLSPGENPPVQADSNELNAQMRRIVATLPANFLSEEDVPRNPTPLTVVEQALDLASQTSSIPQKIPLFAAEPEPVTTMPAPIAAPALPLAPPPAPNMFAFPVPARPSNVATVEFVQSMGLPPFLVGQNTQALQTLAASPGLLSAFKDILGNYDQAKILNLVQTLTANIPGAMPPAPVPPPPPQQFPPANGGMQHFGQQYGVVPQIQQYQAPPPPPPQATSMYSAPGSFQSNSDSMEGNLHLSGFGPMITADEIIQLFSPYVKVDEVVPKNGFMFLNTSDPPGAHRAKEALTGVMVGGGPLRINPAVRRNKNQYGNESASVQSRPRTPAAPAATTTPLPRDALGQILVESVRDDRGNPATRNLFVAGYGSGTTEQQIRETFSQFCQVTGIVMKSSFSFVNTSEKKAAVTAREALTGAQVNGGQLRINFAKESGRLGTTFDNNQPSQRSFSPPQQQSNYYGRSH